MKLFLQLLANGIVNAALYGVLAIGFGLVWRSLHIFHVAYAGLYVFCAYLFFVCVTFAGLPISVALLATVLCGGAVGAVVESALYRPFFRRGAGSGPLLVASLGLFVIIENTTALVFGNELKTIPHELAGSAPLGPIALTHIQLIQLSVGTTVIAGAFALTQRSHLVKALWALGDQPELVPVLGLPILALRILVLAASTGLVAIAASLITLDVGVDPHVGLHYLLIATVAVLVGGVNNFHGWVAGALLLALTQSIAVWQFSTRWMDLVTFALLNSGPPGPSRGREDRHEAAGGAVVNYVEHILIMIGIYLPLAYALNLPMGFGGLISFCHAAFYGLGAYAYALLVTKAGFPTLAALFGAVSLAAFLAAIIGIIALKFRGDLFLFVTLGFQMVIFIILYNWVDVTNGPYGVTGIPRPDIFGGRVASPLDFLILALAMNAILLPALFAVYRSPFGLYAKGGARERSRGGVSWCRRAKDPVPGVRRRSGCSRNTGGLLRRIHHLSRSDVLRFE